MDKPIIGRRVQYTAGQAFLAETSGLYTREEMAQADNSEVIEGEVREVKDTKQDEKASASQSHAKVADQKHQEELKIHALGKIAKKCREEFGDETGQMVYSKARVYAVNKLQLGDVPDGLMPDAGITEMWNAVNNAIARQKQAETVGASSGK